MKPACIAFMASATPTSDGAKSATDEKQRKLSDSHAPSRAGEGYLSTLGLDFSASNRDVIKSYRRSALILHPDKVAKAGSGNRLMQVEKFQAVNTAYQVLSNEHARAKYMAMYRIRCHLYQQPHVEGAKLAPFYVLHVKKKDPIGMEQQRVLTLDLCARARTPTHRV